VCGLKSITLDYAKVARPPSNERVLDLAVAAGELRKSCPSSELADYCMRLNEDSLQTASPVRLGGRLPLVDASGSQVDRIYIRSEIFTVSSRTLVGA
jgi:hypothetical protein